MKSRSFIITGALVAAIAMSSPIAAFAASKKKTDASPTPSPTASASSSSSGSSTQKAARAIPFRGTVANVDQNAKTFTIQGKEKSRTFKVTDNTKVTKAGASASFADITANGYVTGSYWKQADGSLECKSVKVGGTEGQSGSTKKSKSDQSASPSASPKK